MNRTNTNKEFDEINQDEDIELDIISHGPNVWANTAVSGGGYILDGNDLHSIDMVNIEDNINKTRDTRHTREYRNEIDRKLNNEFPREAEVLNKLLDKGYVKAYDHIIKNFYIDLDDANDQGVLPRDTVELEKCVDKIISILDNMDKILLDETQELIDITLPYKRSTINDIRYPKIVLSYGSTMYDHNIVVKKNSLVDVIINKIKEIIDYNKQQIEEIRIHNAQFTDTKYC